MDMMTYAATSQKGVSNEALDTFKGIAQSILERGNMSAWDTANIHMRAALLQAKRESSSKKEFITKAKQATGILKNTHPVLVWCVANWTF